LAPILTKAKKPSYPSIMISIPNRSKSTHRLQSMAI
jgi:hypothetical protein